MAVSLACIHVFHVIRKWHQQLPTGSASSGATCPCRAARMCLPPSIVDVNCGDRFGSC